MDKPIIAVCSMFRDSQLWYDRKINHVNIMFKQLLHQTYGFENLKCYFLTGDSSDNTEDALLEISANYDNINVFTQPAEFHTVSSTVNPSRIKSLSKLGDTLISHTNEQLIFWVESDLRFQQDLIQRLMTRMEKTDMSKPNIISTPCYYGSDGQFYDTWAYRNLDGSQWTANTNMRNQGIVEMSSIGSCALINRTDVRVNFGEGAFPELCVRARSLGGKVLTDCNQSITHPKNEFIGGRWI